MKALLFLFFISTAFANILECNNVQSPYYNANLCASINRGNYQCPAGTFAQFNGVSVQCVSSWQQQPFAQGCFGPLSTLPANPFVNFPSPLYQPRPLPWWAQQGNLYYPNMFYPGAWSYPGIIQNYYPGQGQVFAAKPNIYVSSIHNEKKFEIQFTSEDKPHFLATTPWLDKTLRWKGKIIEHDKFRLDEVFYDYLFYDVRLPKEKMQFERGTCAEREQIILWMIKDLQELKFSSLAIQDFEEHWRVKIPNYPFYCVYPQYNHELDPILPIKISVDQSTFIRSLYVLIPHQKEPDIDEVNEPSLPTADPLQYRPPVKIQREVEFREWGVAFLGF